MVGVHCNGCGAVLKPVDPQAAALAWQHCAVCGVAGVTFVTVLSTAGLPRATFDMRPVAG